MGQLHLAGGSLCWAGKWAGGAVARNAGPPRTRRAGAVASWDVLKKPNAPRVLCSPACHCLLSRPIRPLFCCTRSEMCD